jgi:hypothetical protein
MIPPFAAAWVWPFFLAAPFLAVPFFLAVCFLAWVVLCFFAADERAFVCDLALVAAWATVAPPTSSSASAHGRSKRVMSFMVPPGGRRRRQGSNPR